MTEFSNDIPNEAVAKWEQRRYELAKELFLHQRYRLNRSDMEHLVAYVDQFVRTLKGEAEPIVQSETDKEPASQMPF